MKIVWLLISLQAGCLINTRLYEDRLDALSSEDPSDDPSKDELTDTPTGETGDTGVLDRDGDGVDAPLDCNDDNPNVYPGACDLCEDNIDQNCFGGDAPCHHPLQSGYDLDTHARWINGVSPFDIAGLAVASAGDFDGDGFTDVIVGASHADPGGRARAGSAYLRLTPGSSQLLLADARFDGPSADDRAGAAVGAVDVDEDGFDDLLIAAKGHQGDLGDMGGVYLVYGDPLLASGEYSLADQGVLWLGEAGSHAGNALVGVENMGEQPGRDVAIAAERAGQNRGSVSIVSGGTTFYEVGRSYPLEIIGATITGEQAGDRFGSSLAGAPDLDGDGLGDLVIGAQSANLAYLWSGDPLQLAGSSSSAADAAWVLSGVNAEDRAGSAVGAGDLDGDGYSDAVIGARNHGRGGAAYVVTQNQLAPGPSPSPLGLELSDAILSGEARGERVGQALAVVGDLNCDRVEDLVIGADGYDLGRGAAYVVFGPVTGDRQLGDDPNVVRLFGTPETDGALGSSVAALGDLDRDGCDDFAVGAHRYTDLYTSQGRVWLVFGTP